MKKIANELNERIKEQLDFDNGFFWDPGLISVRQTYPDPVSHPVGDSDLDTFVNNE